MFSYRYPKMRETCFPKNVMFFFNFQIRINMWYAFCSRQKYSYLSNKITYNGILWIFSLSLGGMILIFKILSLETHCEGGNKWTRTNSFT